VIIQDRRSTTLDDSSVGKPHQGRSRPTRSTIWPRRATSRSRSRSRSTSARPPGLGRSGCLRRSVPPASSPASTRPRRPRCSALRRRHRASGRPSGLANRAQPGRFFYENALMGIELLEACRVTEVPEVVVSGTVCAYLKHAPVPFRETDLWDGYPEETNALRAGQEDDPRSGAGVPGPVRHERRLPAAGEPLRSTRQLRPGELARDPGDDPQVHRSSGSAGAACDLVE
jgi:hypothetical protein